MKESSMNSRFKQYVSRGKLGLIACILAITAVLTTAGLSGGDAIAEPTKKTGKKYSDTLLELKFNDDSDIISKGKTFSGTGADEVNAILGKAKVEKNSQLVAQDKASLKKLRTDLKGKGKEVPDLSQWHLVKIPANVNIDDIAQQLKDLAVVQDAYPQPTAVMAPVTPNFEGAQTHQQAAPNGVNTPKNPTWPGARGGNVELTDIEYSWNVNHEDLSKARAAGALIANGTPADPFSNNDHGTAVIGITSADHNGLGTYGSVVDAKLQLVNSYNTTGYQLANAINLARLNSSAGDVILIEQQISGPDPNLDDFVPVEWFGAYYDAIKLATAANITVIEAGGNGDQNLDDASKYGSPFPSGKVDSGAIIVGAGGGCTSSPTTLNSRLSFSNYGTRVNVQGNGNCVVTTGYGTYLNGGPNATYTTTFSGTSSASPVIASAAVAFSSAYEQLNGSAPSAALVRSTLSNIANGTPQNFGAGTLTGNIGPKPDLNKVLLKTDITVPVTPGTFNATIVAGKPSLTWSNTTDNVAVTAYRIYRDGALIATIPAGSATAYTDNTAASGSRQYKITAIDKSINESGYSTTRTVSVP